MPKRKNQKGPGVQIQKQKIKGRCVAVCVPCDRQFSEKYRHTSHTMDTSILAHRSCYTCGVSFNSADHYRLHCALRHRCPLPHKLKFKEDKAAGIHRSRKRDMSTVPLPAGIPFSDVEPTPFNQDKACYICCLVFPDKATYRQHEFFEHLVQERSPTLSCKACGLRNIEDPGTYEGHMKLYAHSKRVPPINWWKATSVRPNTTDAQRVSFITAQNDSQVEGDGELDFTGNDSASNSTEAPGDENDSGGEDDEGTPNFQFEEESPWPDEEEEGYLSDGVEVGVGQMQEGVSWDAPSQEGGWMHRITALLEEMKIQKQNAR